MFSFQFCSLDKLKMMGICHTNTNVVRETKKNMPKNLCVCENIKKTVAKETNNAKFIG